MSLDTSYIYNPGNTTTGNVTNSSSQTRGKHELDMNDFLMLMVEQMKNQDINSTMDTSEYINQLSQYTMIQAVTEMAEAVTNGFSNLQEMTLSSYSMSMIGKEATIAKESATGELETITGTIEGVTFYNGSPMVIIDGTQYELSSVMSLGAEGSGTATKLAEAAISAAQAAAQAATTATDTAQNNVEMAKAILEMAQKANNEQPAEEVQEKEPKAPVEVAGPETTVSTDATTLAAQSMAAQKLAEDL